MKRGYAVVRESARHFPFLLQELKDEKLIGYANSLFPVDTGIEVEAKCVHEGTPLDVMHLSYEYGLPPDMISYGEQTHGSFVSEVRCRIRKGVQGLLDLYNFCRFLKKCFYPNPDSGIHFHIDCTDIHEFNTSGDMYGVRGFVTKQDWILSALDSWGYKGLYNKRVISDIKSSWVKMDYVKRTIEFRVCDMSFDYSFLFKRILHCQNIVRKLKGQIAEHVAKKRAELAKQAELKFAGTGVITLSSNSPDWQLENLPCGSVADDANVVMVRNTGIGVCSGHGLVTANSNVIFNNGPSSETRIQISYEEYRALNISNMRWEIPIFPDLLRLVIRLNSGEVIGGILREDEVVSIDYLFVPPGTTAGLVSSDLFTFINRILREKWDDEKRMREANLAQAQMIEDHIGAVTQAMADRAVAEYHNRRMRYPLLGEEVPPLSDSQMAHAMALAASRIDQQRRMEPRGMSEAERGEIIHRMEEDARLARENAPPFPPEGMPYHDYLMQRAEERRRETAASIQRAHDDALMWGTAGDIRPEIGGLLPLSASDTAPPYGTIRSDVLAMQRDREEEYHRRHMLDLQVEGMRARLEIARRSNEEMIRAVGISGERLGRTSNTQGPTNGTR